MTEPADLLAAVLASPDDDTLRLVYADALDDAAADRGEPVPCPRAELIRVQIGIERCRHSDEDVAERKKRLKDLQARSDELTSAHGDDWVPRVDALWEWQRGFAGAITGIAAADWLAHAEAILAEHPVRKVRLTTFGPRDRAAVVTRLSAIGFRGGAGRLWSELASKVWPGIEFELPLLATAVEVSMDAIMSATFPLGG